jgi:iron complex outermembrane recepter protein
MISNPTIFAICFSTLAVLASAQPVPLSRPSDTVVVTGRYEPLPLSEADRSVTVLPVVSDRWLYASLPDLLQLAPSVDLRQRAPGGVQADLSIRGSSFGQTLVLVDGIRVNDAQTGHHNLDLPMPLDAVERIEVLRGSGSTLYGADAVGGVVNLVTKKPETSEFRIGSALGNFGVNQQRISASWVTDGFSEQLSLGREFSSGFMPDRDYRNLSLSTSTYLTTPLGVSSVLLAYGDRPFGADQFYGNYSSWERTKTWLVSLRQPLGDATQVFFGYRRHADLFVLVRDQPAFYTNRHRDASWQGGLRRRRAFLRNASFDYGVEAFHDSIDSNNLGTHSRSRAAAYAGVDVRALSRFSFTLGVREEVYRKWSTELSPTAAAGVWLSARWKLRTSLSHAFRLPSYTDLYYSDPANVGSPNLRPERAWSYESGASWNSGGRWKADAAYFERWERDGIDYVRVNSDDLWRAANFQRLHFRGVEASVDASAARNQRIGLEYCALRGAQDAISGVESRYVFNYPSQTAVVTWASNLPGHITARSRIGVTARRARDVYAVWDVRATAVLSRARPYLEVSNLSGSRYEEITGVLMPGRSLVVGLDVVIFGRP